MDGHALHVRGGDASGRDDGHGAGGRPGRLELLYHVAQQVRLAHARRARQEDVLTTKYPLRRAELLGVERAAIDPRCRRRCGRRGG